MGSEPRTVAAPTTMKFTVSLVMALLLGAAGSQGAKLSRYDTGSGSSFRDSSSNSVGGGQNAGQSTAGFVTVSFPSGSRNNQAGFQGNQAGFSNNQLTSQNNQFNNQAEFNSNHFNNQATPNTDQFRNHAGHNTNQFRNQAGHNTNQFR